MYTAEYLWTSERYLRGRYNYPFKRCLLWKTKALYHQLAKNNRTDPAISTWDIRFVIVKIQDISLEYNMHSCGFPQDLFSPSSSEYASAILSSVWQPSQSSASFFGGWGWGWPLFLNFQFGTKQAQINLHNSFSNALRNTYAQN